MSSRTMREFRRVADTGVDRFRPLERRQRATVDPAPWLIWLRREFPRWAFLFDPCQSLWVAVRGRDHISVARTAIELREALEQYRRHRP